MAGSEAFLLPEDCVMLSGQDQGRRVILLSLLGAFLQQTSRIQPVSLTVESPEALRSQYRPFPPSSHITAPDIRVTRVCHQL